MKPTDEVNGRIEQAIDLYEKAGGKWADEARSELAGLRQQLAGAYAAAAKVAEHHSDNRFLVAAILALTPPMHGLPLRKYALKPLVVAEQSQDVVKRLT